MGHWFKPDSVRTYHYRVYLTEILAHWFKANISIPPFLLFSVGRTDDIFRH